MNDIVNDKKGHNIENDKIAAMLISQTAYLLFPFDRNLLRIKS